MGKSCKVCCNSVKSEHKNKIKCFFKGEIGLRLNCTQSLYLQLLWHSTKCFRPIIENQSQKIEKCAIIHVKLRIKAKLNGLILRFLFVYLHILYFLFCFVFLFFIFIFCLVYFRFFYLHILYFVAF